MSERSWFYAAQGQQQGPFPEPQFRNLIARNTVTADTLVWTDGMSGWQRCEDIPGLMSGRSGPPAMPPSRGQPASPGQPGAAGQYGGGQYAAVDQYAGDRYGGGGGALAFDAGVFPFFGQSLLYAIGLILVVPAPWLATGYYRWGAPHVRVPDRPNLAFNGQPMDIWWALAGIGACSLIYAVINSNLVHLVAFLALAYLYWVVLRWVISNLSSNGQPLPITFNGNVLTFIGWHVLGVLSFITIVGWAWVFAAQMRWICRNIGGTNREILFKATGLEILWRGLVLGIACIFIIPIPWMMTWYAKWMISQFELVDRAA